MTGESFGPKSVECNAPSIPNCLWLRQCAIEIGFALSFGNPAEEKIVSLIGQNAEKSVPVTKREIRHEGASQLSTPITRGLSIGLFFVTPMKSSTRKMSQEEQGLQVPQTFFHRTV
jgi:hypothetical protein